MINLKRAKYNCRPNSILILSYNNADCGRSFDEKYFLFSCVSLLACSFTIEINFHTVSFLSNAIHDIIKEIKNENFVKRDTDYKHKK